MIDQLDLAKTLFNETWDLIDKPGRTDEDNIANQITSTRESVDKITSWVGFTV